MSSLDQTPRAVVGVERADQEGRHERASFGVTALVLSGIGQRRKQGFSNQGASEHHGRIGDRKGDGYGAETLRSRQPRRHERRAEVGQR